MGRKTAIITGANRGVGRGVANVFAEKGYDLFLAYNGETEKAKEVQQYVTEKYGVRCELFDCDLSKVEDIYKLVDTAIGIYGKIDVLMSNAGVGYEKYLRYAKVEEIDHVYMVNYRAGILLATLVGQHMIDNKIKGSMVFTASVKSIQPTPIDCIYGGMKAGLKRSVQSIAREFVHLESEQILYHQAVSLSIQRDMKIRLMKGMQIVFRLEEQEQAKI